MENRWDVGGDEVFVLAQANDRWRAVAGGDDGVRGVSRDHAQSEHAGYLAHSLAHGFFQRGPSAVAFGKISFNQVGNNFSVSFRGELVAFFDELFLQREVVLDDPIVHDDDSPGAVAMRGRILFRGTAMWGPSGVANAVGSIERFEADAFFEITQLAFGATNLQTVAIAAHCDSGGVVPAIFEAPKPLDDDGHHTLLAHISNNAAHGLLRC